MLLNKMLATTTTSIPLEAILCPTFPVECCDISAGARPGRGEGGFGERVGRAGDGDGRAVGRGEQRRRRRGRPGRPQALRGRRRDQEEIQAHLHSSGLTFIRFISIRNWSESLFSLGTLCRNSNLMVALKLGHMCQTFIQM